MFSSVFFCLASNKAIAPFALSAFKQLITFLSTIPFNNLVSIGSLHSIINWLGSGILNDLSMYSFLFFKTKIWANLL